MKSKLQLLVVAAIITLLSGIAHAVPITYSETFLGDKKDNSFMDIQQGWVASFGFNITGPGDTAQLKNSNQQIVNSWSPSADSSGFGGAGNYSILDAHLNFTFSSSDSDRERVTIRAGLFDGNRVLSQQTFTLGSVPIRDSYLFRSSSGSDWDRQKITREYADFSLDLLELGLGASLADGKFMTLVLATDLDCDNDFRIDRANLELTAESAGAPVPEPGTVLLLGSGLLGLAFSRRLFRRR